MKKNIVIACIVTIIGIFILSFSQTGSKNDVSTQESTITPTSASTVLSSANLTQDEYNQFYKIAAAYLNGSKPYKCPDAVTFYDWKVKFYKDNPDLSLGEFSQRSNYLMQQNNYLYWACGIVFLNTYHDQEGQYLQEHGYNITPTPTTALSNDNYYTNSDGNQVHSPAYSNNDSIPAGATAQCADGTYSFSQHRRGTCSHHGGVAEWL
jgi:hypothetical protein